VVTGAEALAGAAGGAAGAASSLAMLFKIGDWVVHPLHGVGQVVKLDRKDFGSPPGQLYYEIAISQGTLWVMAETPPAGLRGLTAKADLPRYRALLQSAPVELNKDYHQRRWDLRERLKDGTFQARCEVVRDLTAHGWQKRLSEPDAALLRATRDGLCQEWAEAEAVTVTQATQEVEELLRAAKQKHLK
jgi:CarD family transcriptional regulator